MGVLSKFQVRKELARVMDAWRNEGKFPVVVLPSTKAAFEFATRLNSQIPTAVIGDREMMAKWAPALSERVRRPLALWKELKGQHRLPFAIFCFQDQLVGCDASFSRVSINEKTYIFSIIETMLLMRYQPPMFVGVCAGKTFTGRRGSIAIRRYSRAISAEMPKAMFDEVIRELMQPMIESLDAADDDWLARKFFRLKVDHNIEKMLATRLLEIESLLRIGNPTEAWREADNALLGELKASRKQLLCPAA
jgi:hypothetical protein